MVNKGGRPKGAKTKVVHDLEASAKRHGRASLDVLTDVVEDKEAPGLGRVLAAQTLLEIGYGRPAIREPAPSLAAAMRRHGLG